MSILSNLHRSSRLAAIAISCAMVTACATLPDLTYLDTLKPTASATITNGQAVLPERRAAALLTKRLRSTKVDLQTLAALEEAVTGFPLISGNKVTLLFDGPQTLGAMMAAIKNAKDHINLETYIFDQDELGLKFAELLIEKQRAGVQVNIMYDSVGTLGTPGEFFKKMRDAGIALTEFNPVNPLAATTSWRTNNRDHRKILIGDGVIGFAGGVNIAGDYANSSLFRSKSRR
ncbi:MAG: cardiolipin synthase B, partial [Herminiimonas sp.]|nr:cardiolipin synthase B [Herminiimonas sp.]